MTVLTILIYCSRKKGFGHLLTFTIKALTNTDAQANLLILLILHQSFEIEKLKGH